MIEERTDTAVHEQVADGLTVGAAIVHDQEHEYSHLTVVRVEDWILFRSLGIGRRMVLSSRDTGWTLFGFKVNYEASKCKQQTSSASPPTVVRRPTATRPSWGICCVSICTYRIFGHFEVSMMKATTNGVYAP